MKKIKILILFLLLFTTGCLNYTELNDIGIINTIGITKNKDNYIVNINMLTPTEKNLEKNKTYKVNANSLNNAFDKLYLRTSKSINLSHLELLILDSNLNKKEFDDIKDFFFNKTDSRNTFNVIVLENYSNENVFKFTQEEINNLIVTNNNEDGLVSPKTFDEMIEDILTINISYIPTIKIDTDINILGYRSIYKENKLLSKEESIAYNFITNRIKKCNLIFDDINIKIEKSNTKLNIVNNNIKINISSTIQTNNIEPNIKNLYIKTIKQYINDFIKNNNLEYFYNIKDKYNYKNNKSNKINFIITINPKQNIEVYYE